jgi:adenine deaminase
MLCSDDYHPDDLINAHLDRLIRRGILSGINFFNLYRAASINPVLHYQLRSGILRNGDPADFIIASGSDPFKVIATYINGICVFGEGQVKVELPPVKLLNAFHAMPVSEKDLQVRGSSGNYHIIRVWDGELITGSEIAYLDANQGIVEGNLSRDLLKIVVINRYTPAPPSIGWITGFGLKSGAIASSIAHDSHNVIAVGTSDAEIASAINLVIEQQGGIAVSRSVDEWVLPLPVAGLMCTDEADVAGMKYSELTAVVKDLGSTLKAPFMALSFMALLVIPHLKIGDRGLFNCDQFEFIDLKAD